MAYPDPGPAYAPLSRAEAVAVNNRELNEHVDDIIRREVGVCLYRIQALLSQCAPEVMYDCSFCEIIRHEQFGGYKTLRAAPTTDVMDGVCEVIGEYVERLSEEPDDEN